MVNLGSKVKVRIRFRNSLGVLADPTSVFFKVRQPDAVKLSYQYAVDAEIEREAAGVYTWTKTNVDQSGRWQLEARGTGDLVVVIKGSFDVARSVFSNA